MSNKGRLDELEQPRLRTLPQGNEMAVMGFEETEVGIVGRSWAAARGQTGPQES
jgi:hypothetical protein